MNLFDFLHSSGVHYHLFEQNMYHANYHKENCNTNNEKQPKKVVKFSCKRIGFFPSDNVDKLYFQHNIIRRNINLFPRAEGVLSTCQNLFLLCARFYRINRG